MVTERLSGYVREYIDPIEWNTLVRQHPRNHLLQSWGWGKLKGAFGWRPLRVAAGDASGRVAAAQVLFKEIAGLSVAYVPRGPLFSGDDELDRLLLQSLRRLARRQRAAFLRLEPNIIEADPEAPRIHSLLQLHDFRTSDPMQPWSSIHLDLRPSTEQLFAALSKGHRADVRRAERTGVQVRVGTTAGDLAAFYAIMEATATRAGFGIHSADYYAMAFRAMRESWYHGRAGGEGASRLLLAEYDGATVAAFLIFAWGREGQYMYSGANESGLKVGANHLLQWHAIQWAKEQGCERYDLWGVPEVVAELERAPESERAAIEERAKTDPLYGPYRFKKGWGGQIVRYLPAYDQVYIAPAYWWWKRRRSA